jgi:hypothetical protein
MHGTIGGPVYKPGKAARTMAHDPRKTTTGAAADRTMQNMVRQTKTGRGTLTYTPNRKGKGK